MQENKASLQEPQERTMTKTSADMWEPLPADRQKGLLYCNTGVLFRPMLSVPKIQDVDIKTVLNHKMHGCHLTSTFLFFFFNNDGSMRKITKSDKGRKLESVSDELLRLPTDSATKHCLHHRWYGNAAVPEQSFYPGHTKAFDPG